jgi:hypothetical protein
MSNTVTTTTGTGTGSGVQEKAGEVAATAKDQAQSVAATAKQRAGEVLGTAKEQAEAVAGDAKQHARQLLDDSRQQLREQAGAQTSKAAGSIRDLGDQLQRMANGEGAAEGPLGDLTRQAADGMQRLAGSLENRRPEELVDDVKRFARQRPGLFVLGALGAGFAVGRLLRTVDTSSIKEAASSGMGSGSSGPSPADSFSGPATLGSGFDTTEALATGMAGTTPGDLADPAPTSTSTLRTEPLRAGPLDAGLDTGSER